MREIKMRYIVRHIASGNIEVKHYSLSQIEKRPLEKLSPAFLADYELVARDQYTGLKDKNGQEIYEGDIVKGHWWEKGDKHRHIGKVTYVLNAFKVRGVKQYFGMDDELNPTYEIIGNIYEHPHLLKEATT